MINPISNATAQAKEEIRVNVPRFDMNALLNNNQSIKAEPDSIQHALQEMPDFRR